MNAPPSWIPALILSASLFAERTARAADPTTADCLAASDASLKSGNEHKLRAERSELLVCSAPSCPSDIRKECAARIEELNTQIPTIVFAAKNAAGADLSAVKVRMDGEVLAERLEGTALSIDPGAHTFVFEAAGESPLSRKLVIQQGQKDRAELITFGSSVLTPVPPEPSRGLGTQKVLALVAAGVGVVGLGVGTAFGVVTMSQKSDASKVCPSNPCSTQDGVDRWSTAASSGNVSTAFFLVGGVGLAGGAVLWFTAPKVGPAKPEVGFGLGAVRLRGTF